MVVVAKDCVGWVFACVLAFRRLSLLWRGVEEEVDVVLGALGVVGFTFVGFEADELSGC